MQCDSTVQMSFNPFRSESLAFLDWVVWYVKRTEKTCARPKCKQIHSTTIKSILMLQLINSNNF